MDFFLQFMRAIEDDARIGTTHISIYLALVFFFEKNAFRNPIVIKRDEVMRRAKIHARHTYNVCMNQLHQYGYTRYIPSSNPKEGSQVYINIK